MKCVQYIVLEGAGDGYVPEGSRFLVHIDEGQEKATHKEVKSAFEMEFCFDPWHAFVCVPVSEIEDSIKKLEDMISRKKDLLSKFPCAKEELDRFLIECEEDEDYLEDDEDLKGFEKSLEREQKKRERRYLERLNDDDED